MAGTTTSKAQPETQAPQSGNPGARLASMVLAAAVGGGVGYVFGRIGDKQKRNLAQLTFAGMGAVFGGLLSFFATKRVPQPAPAPDEQTYYSVSGMGLDRALPSHAPQPETAVQGAAHDGRIDEAVVRTVGR